MIHTAATPGPSAETERRWGDPGDRLRGELGRRASVFMRPECASRRAGASAGRRGREGWERTAGGEGLFAHPNGRADGRVWGWSKESLSQMLGSLSETKVD